MPTLQRTDASASGCQAAPATAKLMPTLLLACGSHGLIRLTRPDGPQPPQVPQTGEAEACPRCKKGLLPSKESSFPGESGPFCVQSTQSNSTLWFAGLRAGPPKTGQWAWRANWSSVNEEEEIGPFDHRTNHLEVWAAVSPGKGDLGLDTAGPGTLPPLPPLSPL